MHTKRVKLKSSWGSWKKGKKTQTNKKKNNFIFPLYVLILRLKFRSKALAAQNALEFQKFSTRAQLSRCPMNLDRGKPVTLEDKSCEKS